MDRLLVSLRAAAEPTRLRLLALLTRGAFCVTELTEILGQSQPRLSRHLKLLCEGGLVERVREGSNVWFTLPSHGERGLVDTLVPFLPADDPVLAADRRQAARVLAERARVASESFRRKGADWDEMRALDLPARAVEDALLGIVADGGRGRLLDIGTGTGRILELLASHISAGLGIDASKAMLALARSRLAGPEFHHCRVRLADMYRLPLPDASFDTVVLQMVLHYSEDPASVIAEAGRVLADNGRMIIVDLAAHDRIDVADRLAHRWRGFADATMHDWLHQAGHRPERSVTIPGPLKVRVWTSLPDGPAALPDQTAVAVA